MKLYDFQVRSISGHDVSLRAYEGRVVLIVNVASRCGYTPQYQQLEALERRYGDAGLSVLGFPCNQFGGQEPGTEAQIEQFCRLKYDITFAMFAKIRVNGRGADPLYKWLKDQAPGLMGSRSVKWNFTKFLVHRDGKTVTRFGTRIKPRAIEAPIIKALAE